MQLPSVPDIYQQSGSLKPLSYYSYDAHNNVIAYCDPVYNQTYGNQWVSSPGDSLCPSGSNKTTPPFSLLPIRVASRTAA